jgi:uncharacterized protein (DUF433 family)
MSSQTIVSPIPLDTDASGTIRVGGTRVTLDAVVAAFCEGATAEEIVQQYPTLKLSDVYHVLGYYLEHQTKVDDYIRQRQVAAEQVKAMNESRANPVGVRARLMARRGQ